MKIARLVIGIVSLVIIFIIGFQSCAAGISNALQENGQSSGTYGFITGFFIMVAGIIAICARSSKPGGFVAGGFYIFAFLFGIANYGNYSDLAVWSVISLMFGIFFIISSAVMKKKPAVTNQSPYQNQFQTPPPMPQTPPPMPVQMQQTPPDLPTNYPQ